MYDNNINLCCQSDLTGRETCILLFYFPSLPCFVLIMAYIHPHNSSPITSVHTTS